MTDGAAFQGWLAQAITRSGALDGGSAPPAVAVYRNTWVKGLLDALDANYPTVAMILGTDLFRAVAVEYARGQPPTTPILALYGAAFPEFLATRLAECELPYLPDVAKLERLWTECFFAPDAPALDTPGFGSLEPRQLLAIGPRLHPATRIARFDTPAVTIWQAHRVEGELEEIEPEWTPEIALVTRRGQAVSVTLIEEPAYTLLSEIKRGRTLGSAMATVIEVHPSTDPGKALSTIISSAALTGAA